MNKVNVSELNPNLELILLKRLKNLSFQFEGLPNNDRSKNEFIRMANDIIQSFRKEFNIEEDIEFDFNFVSPQRYPEWDLDFQEAQRRFR